MNKKGFMFIESVTVLIIVALSLTLLISSYALVIRKSKENEYYDLPSDKYLLYVIGNLGENDQPYNTTDSFKADKDNCNEFMSNRVSSCSEFYKSKQDGGLDLVYYIVINSLREELKSSKNPTQTYDSGTIEYLKTLKRCTTSSDSSCKDGYVVGVFKRNDKYYYVSLEL